MAHRAQLTWDNCVQVAATQSGSSKSDWLTPITMTPIHRPSSGACCHCGCYQSLTLHQVSRNWKPYCQRSLPPQQVRRRLAAASLRWAAMDQKGNRQTIQVVCAWQPIMHELYCLQLLRLICGGRHLYF